MTIAKFFSSLDVQTATFLISLAMLIQASLIAIQSALVKEYRGVRTAALANLGIALGIFLMSFRDSVPDLLSIIAANYLQIIGVTLLYVAICRFIGVTHSVPLVTFAVLPVMLLFPYFTFVNDNLTARIVLIDFGGILILAGITMSLFRVREEAYCFTSNLLMAAIGAYTIVLVFRTLEAIFVPPQSLFESSLMQIVFVVALFITSYLWSSVFSLMVSQRLQVDLNELATLDSLTRISNRRGMMLMLEAEFARKLRTQNDFSVLLVDLDHFKKINDGYGHVVGDKVLHSVAQLMRQSIRTQDFISRWGGEEFLILLPATNTREAIDIGERLRMAVERELFIHEGAHVSLTVSIGVGDSILCPDLDGIYKCADLALYKAKQTRNAIAWNGNIYVN